MDSYCNICKKTFTRAHDYKRHVREKHQDSSPQLYSQKVLQGLWPPPPLPPLSQQSLTPSQVLPPQLSQMMTQMDNLTAPFYLKHPFTMIVAGPTCCGKTTLVKTILEKARALIQPPPAKIVWCYKRWQPMYTEINIPNLEFMEGLNTPSNSMFMEPVLYVIDDLMKDATKSVDVCELFTEGSHHRNLSVICLLQNLYYKGKENRTMNLNTQYLVLFKNPRDQQQISVLARQMYPKESHKLLHIFNQATQQPYGYLLVDLKQDTPDRERLKPNVINTIKSFDPMQHLHTNSRILQSNIMEYEKPSCPDCGALYATPMGVHKHCERGCPQGSALHFGEPPMKKIRKLLFEEDRDSEEETDDSDEDCETNDTLWSQLLEKRWACHDKEFSHYVEKYENQAFKEELARYKASEDLRQKYTKSLMHIYKEYAKLLWLLNKDPIHRRIMRTVNKKTEKDFDKTLQNAVKRNRRKFEDLVTAADDKEFTSEVEESEDSNSQSSGGEGDDDDDEERNEEEEDSDD
jgi:hypothetical protein